MVNSVVERATSDMLIGPDWAMNIAICDMLNRDPGWWEQCHTIKSKRKWYLLLNHQFEIINVMPDECEHSGFHPQQAKDVVKGIKRRLGSRNSKVQLLSLTLLETVIKNCGDIVHMHVAEKDILHEMVKIVKKKPDFHVKEKILVLIDTWQEAFGGPRARYPQYYAAYQELLRAGAVFPQRSDKPAPVFTPPQTQPLTSYPPNIRNSENRQEPAESSAEAEFPSLSLTEIQNARGIMDVLSEMLNALDPGNKEGLKQEVIVDLVEQCRTYKQRVVHLVNSTVDESLLCQGLALNDDLQRLLGRHEAVASGTVIQTEKLMPEPARRLVDVDGSLVDTGDTSKQLDGRSSSSASMGTQPPLLSLPAAPTTNGGATPPAKLDPKIDLLSGDDYNSPTAANTLALVPVGEPQPTSPASQQNALVLADFFPSSNNAPNSSNAQSVYPAGQAYSFTPQYQQQQNIQSPQSPFYPNGSTPTTMGLNQYEQSMYTQGTNPASTGGIPQQQQPSSPVVYGAQSNGSLPPPPWEAQHVENFQPASTQTSQMQVPQAVYTQSLPIQSGMHPQGPQPMVNGQVGGMYVQPVTGGHFPGINNQFIGFHPQPVQGGQMMGMYPQPLQPGHMASIYPQQMYGNQMAGYGYSQQQEALLLQQRMYELSVRDDSALRNSFYQVSTSSFVPPSKPSKPEDKLFGDLVDIAKFKPTKTTTGIV